MILLFYSETAKSNVKIAAVRVGSGSPDQHLLPVFLSLLSDSLETGGASFAGVFKLPHPYSNPSETNSRLTDMNRKPFTHL